MLNLDLFVSFLFRHVFVSIHGRVGKVDMYISISVHCVFVWAWLAYYNKTKESLNLTLSQTSQFDDRNTWIE
jgi:hypothetical protein